MILEGLDAIGGWRDAAGVLDEVVHLVECPVVLVGTFDERFLELPPLVVETVMQSHQRYFPLERARFAFVANGGDPEVVVAGNERVLDGRLEDALFSFERDVAKGIEAIAAQLGTITFVAGPGALRTRRRGWRISSALGGGEGSLEAARLAKADQAAEIVSEFSELEGYIGGSMRASQASRRGSAERSRSSTYPTRPTASCRRPSRASARRRGQARQPHGLVRDRRAAHRLPRPVRASPGGDRPVPARPRGRGGDRRRSASSARLRAPRRAGCRRQGGPRRRLGLRLRRLEGSSTSRSSSCAPRGRAACASSARSRSWRGRSRPRRRVIRAAAHVAFDRSYRLRPRPTAPRRRSTPRSRPRRPRRR